jgi:uncharacterized protein (TIGR03437 family)
MRILPLPMLLAAAIVMTILIGAVYCQPALGQATPAAIIEVDVENVVEYQGDLSDPSKSATNPNVTPSAGEREFWVNVAFGDIVAVNGQPAKGPFVGRSLGILMTPTPAPGKAIGDTTHGSLRSNTFEILKSDGTPVGTIMSFGLDAGSPPPGAPSYPFETRGDYAIVGGTGAFLGARGELVQRAQVLESNPPRAASMAEDPANRRKNGGGRIQYFLHLIPMSRPEVATTSTGPAVFHADFSPVTAAKPAHAGEVLIVRATGLGPTFPSVNPGQPFPMDVGAVVNSPVDISINGQPAQLINAIGWPGSVDSYRVDFRVPAEAANGMAAIQISAAWIPSAPVSVMVQ